MDFQTVIAFSLTAFSFGYVFRHVRRMLIRGELPSQCRHCALQRFSLNANNKKTLQ